ncbi:MAG: hypothetical protein JKX73_04575 [Flavobacteriales bacterium]|nr:hypothetical protein [Flavobacteriales bacterium]
MSKRKYSSCLATIILVFLLSSDVIAQKGVSSPYSRYGIGDVNETGFYRNMGMGGLSIAMYDAKSINIVNPASYTAFKKNSFVFDIGAESKFLTLNTADTTQTTYNTSLSYLTFGFPLTNWWGSSFGIRPFSNVNYKVTTTQTFTNIGDASYIYEGTGGINEVFWGNAVKIKGVSIGANVSYLFGPIQTTRTEIFTLANSFHYYTSEKINVGGFYARGGILATEVMDSIGTKALKEPITLTAGAILEFGTDIKTRRTTLGATFDNYQLDPFLYAPLDTVVHVTDTGNFRLPTGFGWGMTFDYGKKVLVGFDYYTRFWSDFTMFGKSGNLGDHEKMSLGMQLTPDPGSNSYFKNVSYRLGVHKETTFLNPDGVQLDKSGISFGIGLPLRRIKSTINLAVEVGSRGTTDNSLIKENYWKAGFGLTLSDIWFVKRKYN